MDERAKLLIIEDDVNLVEALQLYLTTAGYDVVAASNGREGLQQLYLQQPDLVILDIMMPGLDGWEVCNRVREVSDVPIVMLTARGQEAERVRGLQMGADDYVVKPFSLRELEARIESVLRRARMSPVVQDRVVYADEELVIDSERWEVTRRGKPVELTATERRLLFLVDAQRRAGIVSCRGSEGAAGESDPGAPDVHEDPGEEWLDLRCVRREDRETPAADLYADYREWCEARILSPMPRPEFEARLVRLGGDLDADTWRNLRLLPRRP